MGTMRRNSPEYESARAILSRSGSGSGTRERISYCQDCMKVNVLSPLKDRIYLDENGDPIPPPPDAKNWRQCWQCGTIVGVYEAKTEAELTSLTEPSRNPFKFGKGTVMSGGESRKFDRSYNSQRKKQFKQDLEQHKEEDLKDALGKGARLVSFVETGC